MLHLQKDRDYCISKQLTHSAATRKRILSRVRVQGIRNGYGEAVVHAELRQALFLDGPSSNVIPSVVTSNSLAVFCHNNQLPTKLLNNDQSAKVIQMCLMKILMKFGGLCINAVAMKSHFY